MKRVLVTGATGFVGRATTLALQQRGFEVHGTSKRSALNVGGPSNFAIHEVDLLDAHDVSKLIAKIRPTHVVLSAWTTSHGNYWSDPQNDEWDLATRSLARAFLAAGGRRMILVGTCAEYDWEDPVLRDGPVREDMALGTPHSIYGRAKRRTADALAAETASADATFAVGRLFFPIGPGENSKRLVPMIVNSLRAGHVAALGPGEPVRDFIDVRDAGAALASIADSDVGGAINVGTGIGTSIAELARQLGAIVGRSELISVGALPKKAIEPSLLIADISRLTREVGFRAIHNLHSTLLAAVGYWDTKIMEIKSGAKA